MAGRSRKRPRQTLSRTGQPTRGPTKAKTRPVQRPTGVAVHRSSASVLADGPIGLEYRDDDATRLLGSAIDKARSAARQAFLKRMVTMFTELADTAPESVIVGALAEPTALATAAYALTESAVPEQPFDDADRQIAVALAAGAQYKEELLTRAGGAYSAEQLGELLDISRQAVNEGRKTHLYFAVPTGSNYAYPKLQVTESGLVPGLRDFLDAFTLPDAWMKLSVLVEPSERLEGRSPLEALRAGDVDGAVMVAATYGGHGA